jgi:hypothetical protein
MKRVLLDECVPRQLGKHLSPHLVSTVTRSGWSGIKNGALLKLASQAFDVFVSVDRGLLYQQQIATLPIAVILLRARSNDINDLTPLAPKTMAAIENISAGCVVVIQG